MPFILEGSAVVSAGNLVDTGVFSIGVQRDWALSFTGQPTSPGQLLCVVYWRDGGELVDTVAPLREQGNIWLNPVRFTEIPGLSVNASMAFYFPASFRGLQSLVRIYSLV